MFPTYNQKVQKLKELKDDLSPAFNAALKEVIDEADRIERALYPWLYGAHKLNPVYTQNQFTPVFETETSPLPLFGIQQSITLYQIEINPNATGVCNHIVPSGEFGRRLVLPPIDLNQTVTQTPAEMNKNENWKGYLLETDIRHWFQMDTAPTAVNKKQEEEGPGPSKKKPYKPQKPIFRPYL